LCGEVCSEGKEGVFFLGFGVLGENQELGKDVAYCEQEPPIGWLPQQFCSTSVSSKNHQVPTNGFGVYFLANASSMHIAKSRVSFIPPKMLPLAQKPTLE
jgi:hypothetical protein